MKTTLKLEEAAMTVIGIYLLSGYDLGLPVWIWTLLFFAPDLAMVGYLFNSKAGAIAYNLFHHKGIAIILAITGYYLQNEHILATGTLLFAHASFDRIWGYGLKYATGFSNTHLGNIGKNK
jgi:hypothetical protein